MKIEKFTISRDPSVYEAWPDVTLAPGGKLVCVFTECSHHKDRSYTRIMLTESGDRGRNWSPKRPLTEGTAGLGYSYNCARITRFPDGRLAVIVDRIPREFGEGRSELAENLIYFSEDDGMSWSAPVQVPLAGIVPDKITILDSGRWLVSAHYARDGRLTQVLRFSDDGGRSWSREITVAGDPRFNLCEASLLPLGKGTVVAFMRENSGLGWDCKKCISHDGGETWSSPVTDFPLPGCHRPVAGLLRNGEVFITYRFYHGGRPCFGANAQNFFAAFTDVESVCADSRDGAAVRIMPVDYDPAKLADLGYSGWVEFPDGEIYIVSYIVDDAVDKGQIRGYSLLRE